jgi:hypothetical protein
MTKRMLVARCKLRQDDDDKFAGSRSRCQKRGSF